MIKDIDKDIIVEFAKKYNLSKVILFGSALESDNPRDIDIGIKGIRPELFFNFYWDIYSRLSKPVDIINLRKRNKFNKIIEYEGIIIYDKSKRKD